MITEKKIEITPQTFVSELLNHYPELEDKLIEIAPIFIKLKNPVLRRTIAKITTLKQASIVADISLSDLINSLRQAAGQDTLQQSNTTISTTEDITPDWVTTAADIITYDAREDLENSVHPLGKVMGEINKLSEKQLYLLITPFNPAPLIQKVKEKGFETFTRKENGRVETFIGSKQ
jgi:hypothetical protein